MDNRPRVALLIESSRAYGRGLLHGVARYAHTHGPWSLFHQERRIGDDVPAWFTRWTGDGVIARIESPRVRQALIKSRLPCVDLRGLHETPGIPTIDTDDEIVVRMAVKHLTERNFTHLAFCGISGADYSMRRAAHFERQVEQLGHVPHVYTGSRRSRRGDTTALEAEGLLYEDHVAEWLSSLPKPVGVLACNDIRGMQVINACRDHGIAVPEDVAVIGVDNDELLCDLCDPPLSSVEPDCEKIGYEAAAMLDRMMQDRRSKRRGKSRPPRRGRRPNGTTYVPPRGIETRQSTDVLATTDSDVILALQIIRDQACKGIDVDEVVAQTKVSRSTLERRFKRLLGRTPKQEITRVKIERVKRLLTDTTFPLEKIAELSGFGQPGYMIWQFRRKVGVTPGRYRQNQSVIE